MVEVAEIQGDGRGGSFKCSSGRLRGKAKSRFGRLDFFFFVAKNKRTKRVFSSREQDLLRADCSADESLQ